MSAFICIPLERSNGGKKEGPPSPPPNRGWIDALDRSSKERERLGTVSAVTILSEVVVQSRDLATD